MNTPVDFAAGTMIALAGGAIGKSSALRISKTEEQPTVVHVALVGEPGTKKSPILNHLTRPYDLAEQKLREEYLAKREAWDKADEESRGPVPVPPALIIRNSTMEAMIMLHEQNPRGLLWSFDELSGFFAGLNQYKPGGNDRQTFLSLWPQETLSRNRVGDDPAKKLPPRIIKPCVSIIGGIQPSLVQSIRGGGGGKITADDGAMDRFLFIWPPMLPERGDIPFAISDEVLEVWPKALNQLLFVFPLFTEVHFTPEAQKLWLEFTHQHALETLLSSFPSSLRGPWQKLRAYTGRLALILHWLKWAVSEEAPEPLMARSTLEDAIALIGYFKSSLQRIHAGLGLDSRVGQIQKLLHWMNAKKEPAFQIRTAFNELRHRCGFQSVLELQPILDFAERHFWINPLAPTEHPGPGRKPSPWYEINPLLLTLSLKETMQNTQNQESGSQTVSPSSTESPESMSQDITNKELANTVQDKSNTSASEDQSKSAPRTIDTQNDSAFHTITFPPSESVSNEGDKTDAISRELGRFSQMLTNPKSPLQRLQAILKEQIAECRKLLIEGGIEQASHLCQQIRQRVQECLDLEATR